MSLSKKIIFPVMIGVFCTSVFAKTSFRDDNEIQSYSRQYVELLVNEGGIKGYTDNTFKPRGTVTRAEFLSMCYNSFYRNTAETTDEEEYNKIVAENGFDKVWNGSANDMLVNSLKLGLSKQYTGDEWNEPITRAEAAHMLCSSITKLSSENLAYQTDTSIINDWNIISQTEYAEDISYLFAWGIVQGDQNGNFDPDNTLTREDSAILICKALKPELREVRKVNENPFNTVITGERGVRTVKNLVKTAFEPVGKVMYIYGGGWNEADDGAGKEALTLGLSQSWIDFTSKQDSSYNYADYDYEIDNSLIHDGLDCSGFVGWVIYNVMNDGRGYVTNSYKMDDMLADMGLGTITDKSNITEHRAGDIMASNCDDCKHVYICLGECDDGSLLLLHSSPPGVQLTGTYTADGNKNSQAIQLASEYMKKYYPDWYAKFPDSSRNEAYLTHYDLFRWTALSDEEGYSSKSPKEILEDIFTGF